MIIPTFRKVTPNDLKIIYQPCDLNSIKLPKNVLLKLYNIYIIFSN